MMLAPILNFALEGDNAIVGKRVLPLLVIVFVWSFLTHIPIIKSYIPSTSGVTALSFLTMAGIYIVARLMRIRRYDQQMNHWALLIAFVASVGLCCIGFSHYDSPCALIVAVGVFQIVRHVHLPKRLAGFILLISPSMFPVYILHQTYSGFGFVNMGMRAGAAIGISNLWLLTFFAALVVFVSCIATDLIRRVGFFVAERLIDNLSLTKKRIAANNV